MDEIFTTFLHKCTIVASVASGHQEANEELDNIFYRAALSVRQDVLSFVPIARQMVSTYQKYPELRSPLEEAADGIGHGFLVLGTALIELMDSSTRQKAWMEVIDAFNEIAMSVMRLSIACKENPRKLFEKELKTCMDILLKVKEHMRNSQLNELVASTYLGSQAIADLANSAHFLSTQDGLLNRLVKYLTSFCQGLCSLNEKMLIEINELLMTQGQDAVKLEAAEAVVDEVVGLCSSGVAVVKRELGVDGVKRELGVDGVKREEAMEVPPEALALQQQMPRLAMVPLAWIEAVKQKTAAQNKKYYLEHKEQMDAYYATYREEHKEEIAAYGARYYLEHTEEKAAQNKKYYLEHKEEIAAQNKKYYLEHKEQMDAQNLKYREEHKEEKAAYDATYREEHKEEIAAYYAKYYLEHKEQMDAYYATYREEHKEEIAAYGARYYLEHTEEKAAQKKEYREEHKEEIKVQKHKHYLEHKEEIAAYGARYYLEHKEEIAAKKKAKREAATDPKEVLDEFLEDYIVYGKGVRMAQPSLYQAYLEYSKSRGVAEVVSLHGNISCRFSFLLQQKFKAFGPVLTDRLRAPEHIRSQIAGGRCTWYIHIAPTPGPVESRTADAAQVTYTFDTAPYVPKEKTRKV